MADQSTVVSVRGGDLNTRTGEISPDRGIFHEASIAGRPPRAMYLSSPRSLPGSERGLLRRAGRALVLRGQRCRF